MMETHLLARLAAPRAERASRREVLGAFLGAAGLLALSHPAHRVLAQTSPSATPSVAAASIPLGEAVATLEPRAVWEYFSQLTQIPRPSHHEEQVSAFLADFGRDLGLETAVDEVGNVLIRKPSSPGRENRPGVIVQAHMDMVPVKTADSDHDFETDPIDAFIEDGWVRADRTTLGADNGIGVALIMALLEDKRLAHGPLEALFTVTEEDGFVGAHALQPEVLQGALLINVDSEKEGSLTIGSAGGVAVETTMTYQEEPAPTGFTALRLEVAGLQGGHSGIEIDRGRGNALKLLARLLASAREQVDVRLVSLAGGSSYNAIPREAAAIVAVPETEVGSITKFVATFAATIEQELAATEPDLTITATPAELAGKVMTPDAQRRIVAALYGVPNGIIRMSDAVPGLVETSTNIGVVEAADGELAAGFRVRSAMDSQRDDVTAMIASVFGLAGAETIARGAYSGWAPDPASPLLTLMQSVYQDLYERKAEVIAIHAGLETGVIGAKHPGLDVISVGPTIQNVHSPDERLDIASVGKVYDLLVATLARIPPQAAGSS